MTQAEGSQIRELSAGETHLAYEAVLALRTALEGKQDQQEFAEHVDLVLRPQGYRMLGAFQAGREQAVAVAGFRVGDCLAWGHHLYVDDLSTLPTERRQGHARALLDWLVEEGKRLNCAQMHLSSVVGPTRFDAHRFYYNSGLAIHAHHFTREL